MATPLKTDAHVFFEEQGYFAVGDMYQFNGVYVLRYNNEVCPTPLRPNLHYQIFRVEHEFPGENYTTAICAGVMTHAGSEGLPNEQALSHIGMAKKKPV